MLIQCIVCSTCNDSTYTIKDDLSALHPDLPVAEVCSNKCRSKIVKVAKYSEKNFRLYGLATPRDLFYSMLSVMKTNKVVEGCANTKKSTKMKVDKVLKTALTR